MPKDEQEFDLEKLSKDPSLWMRLAMPAKGSGKLRNVFKRNENPFTKDSEEAMEKVQKLLAEGKLYVREQGRSRHFRKVEKDGDKLKLGATEEKKTTGNSSLLGIWLMKANRAYLKWIGLDRISNWLDKRVKRQEEIRGRDKQYKKEYKSMSRKKKKALKELRKQEKKEAKLQKKQAKLQKKQEKQKAKLQKELEKQKEKTNQVRQDAEITPEVDPKLLDKKENQLNQTPETKTEKSPEQPTVQNDQPEHKQEQPESKPVDNEKVDLNFTLNGKKLSGDNLNELPEEVRKAAQLLASFFSGKQLGVEQQQPEAQVVEAPVTEKTQPEPQPEAPKEEVQAPAEEAGQLLQEQPAPEKSWKDIISNALFSHPEGSDMMAEFRSIMDIPETSLYYLAGAVFGVLGQNLGNAEKKKETLDAMLGGRSLGSENDKLVRDGVASAKKAFAENANGNSKPLTQLLTTAVQELKQADRPDSPNHDMIERLQGYAAGIADANELTLPQAEDQKEMHVAQADDGQPEADLQAPLNQPAKLEPEKVNAQHRPQEQKPLPLHERLAEEKLALEGARNWKETAGKVFFSHEGAEEVMNAFKTGFRSTHDRNKYMTSMIVDMFGKDPQENGGKENTQNMLDALLDGRSIGADNDQYMNQAGHNAFTMWSNMDKQKMSELVVNAVRTLSAQASREPGLSSRHVMIGKMIGDIMKLAQENELNPNFTEAEMAQAKGATALGRISRRYLNARQHLSQEPMDMTSEKGATAVRDLLTGNAIEKMMQQDKLAGEDMTSTQILMGAGIWSVDNLNKMTGDSRVRSGVSKDELSNILEKPDGYLAIKAARSVMKVISKSTMEMQASLNRSAQKDISATKEAGQPGMNLL